jgi:hypothetical protein
MWELTNADATLPVAPDNFRFNMGQSGKETASQAAEKLPFAISLVWLEGTFLITKEGAPYIWPDLARCGKKPLLVGARVPIVPEHFRFKASISAWESSLLWRGFLGRRKAHALYQGTTLVVPKRPEK